VTTLREAAEERFSTVKEVLAAVIDVSTYDLTRFKHLVEVYAKAKQHLFDLFGGRLRMETPVDMHLTSDETKAYLIRFHRDLICAGVPVAARDNIYNFLRILHPLDIVENRLCAETVAWFNDTPLKVFPKEYLPQKLQEGMKPSRLMLRFVDDPVMKNTVGQIYSRYIPLFKAKGKVVVSIDPLDLLFISENGIKSCHSLTSGCYRAGNLAYLLDGVTAVAYYYRSTTPWNCGNVTVEEPWKIWRQLVFIDILNRSAVFQKHYPEQHELPAAAARRLVAHALAQYYGTEPKWTIKRDPVEGSRYFIKKGTDAFYLDAAAEVIRLNDKGGALDVDVGREPFCLLCGNELCTTEDLICSSCNNSVTCAACGEAVDTDYAYYYEGNPYCEYCWNEQFVYCTVCDIVVPEEDARYYNNCPYCECCFDSHFTVCSICGETIAVDAEDTYEIDGDYYCSDCFSDRFCCCVMCNAIIDTENDSIVRDVDMYPYCEHCAEEVLVECCKCGNYYRRDYDTGMFHEINGQIYCDSCKPDETEVA